MNRYLRLLFFGIVLGCCCATEQQKTQREDDGGGGWLSDVREEQQEKHPVESPPVFNSDDMPKEFVCELFNREQCDPEERGCNWQEICNFGEHNACYAAFTAANSTAAPDSYMVNLKGKRHSCVLTVHVLCLD